MEQQQQQNQQQQQQHSITVDSSDNGTPPHFLNLMMNLAFVEEAAASKFSPPVAIISSNPR